MPSVERPGKKGVFLQLPQELVDHLKALAESNHRTFRDELIHALQRHLQFPPVVVVEGKDLQDS